MVHPASPRPPRRRRWAAPCLLVVALVAAPACGSDDEPSEEGSGAFDSDAERDDVEYDDETGQDAVTVQARDNTFLSQHLRISAGTTVTFDNRGRNDHNVLPVDDGAFTSIETEAFAPGAEATVTFDEPGEYPYYCSLHGTTTSGMVGTIVVEG